MGKKKTLSGRTQKVDVDVQVHDSTGNVFEDMGMADAEDRLAKARLAQHIVRLIRERKLSQMEAAKKLGIDQPKVSAILRGRLKDFSTDRLMRFITSLSRDVVISVRKFGGADHERGRVMVEV
jgi:predicted XRE-type DNA-binding protein